VTLGECDGMKRDGGVNEVEVNPENTGKTRHEAFYAWSGLVEPGFQPALVPGFTGQSFKVQNTAPHFDGSDVQSLSTYCPVVTVRVYRSYYYVFQTCEMVS
jgi:hypothetical protein